MRSNKVFFSMHKRLMELLNESVDISFEERPFLENMGLPKVITESERRNENEFKIQKAIEAISKELDKKLSKEIPEPKQENIFRMD